MALIKNIKSLFHLNQKSACFVQAEAQAQTIISDVRNCCLHHLDQDKQRKKNLIKSTKLKKNYINLHSHSNLVNFQLSSYFSWKRKVENAVWYLIFTNLFFSASAVLRQVLIIFWSVSQRWNHWIGSDNALQSTVHNLPFSLAWALFLSLG